jgi:hypothetical protein
MWMADFDVALPTGAGASKGALPISPARNFQALSPKP